MGYKPKYSAEAYMQTTSEDDIKKAFAECGLVEEGLIGRQLVELKETQEEKATMKLSFSDSIYSSKTDFNKAYKQFIWQAYLVDLLEGCGWNDGGCRSLMKAFQIWLKDEGVQTYQIVRRKDSFHSDHAFIRIGKYYLDGDGLSTHKRLYQRWKYEEGLPHVFIRAFEPLEEPPLINSHTQQVIEEPFYIKEKSIEKIAVELDKAFDRCALVSLMKR